MCEKFDVMDNSMTNGIRKPDGVKAGEGGNEGPVFGFLPKLPSTSAAKIQS